MQRGSCERPGSRRENHVGSGLDPSALVAEAGVGAHRANHGVGSDFGFLGAFENVLESGSQFSLAAGEKPEGVGVAKECAFGNAKADGDVLRAVPVDEGLFDGFAFLVAADDTFAAMAAKVEWHPRGLCPGGFYAIGAVVRLGGADDQTVEWRK
jgi:hypothetical protein